MFFTTLIIMLATLPQWLFIERSVSLVNCFNETVIVCDNKNQLQWSPEHGCKDTNYDWRRMKGREKWGEIERHDGQREREREREKWVMGWEGGGGVDI